MVPLIEKLKKISLHHIVHHTSKDKWLTCQYVKVSQFIKYEWYVNNQLSLNLVN